MSFDLYHKPPVISAPLLHALLTQQTQHQSLHALAQRASLTIDSLQAELDRLLAVGCELDHHPSHGVTLLRTGAGAWVDYLQWVLGPHRPVVVFNQTASTQDAAKRLLGEKGPSLHGMVITADQQYAGRGRMGRTWLAQPGQSVTFSLIHVAPPSPSHPAAQTLSLDHLIFATAVAVAQGIEAATRHAFHAKIKWPNDVLVNNHKIAGILVEMITLAGGRQAAIIGVGINVGSTPDLSNIDPHRGPRTATSLADHAPPVDRLTVMAHVLPAIDNALATHDTAAMLEDWRARSVLLSQNITLQTPQGHVQGEVIDLSPHEGLILRTTTGAILHLPAATTSVV